MYQAMKGSWEQERKNALPG